MNLLRRVCEFVACALLSIGLTVTSSALAQTGRREARRHFAEGMSALERGRFDEAIVALERSLVLLPRASTAYNLAISFRGMGQVRDALRVCSALRAGEHGELSRTLESSSRTLCEELQGEVSTLRLELRGPEELDARIDGEQVASAPGDIELELDPGVHSVVVVARDYVTIHRTPELRPGERTTEQVSLERAADTRPGSLTLVSEAEDVRLEVVGVRSGPSPLRLQLEPGEYTVRAIGPHGRQESVVTVPPARRVRLVLDPGGRPLSRQPLLWVGIATAILGGAALAIGLSLRTQAPEQVSPYGIITVR